MNGYEMLTGTVAKYIEQDLMSIKSFSSVTSWKVSLKPNQGGFVLRLELLGDFQFIGKIWTLIAWHFSA